MNTSSHTTSTGLSTGDLSLTDATTTGTNAASSAMISSASEKAASIKGFSAATEYNLKNADSFGEFLAKNEENMLTQSLSEHLMSLLERKKLKRADVVRDSDLDKAYVYQIFKGDKKPSRDKLIAIAFGMHLNEDDTQRMLKLAGYSALYPRVARDALILFAIQRGMSIWQTDEALDKNGFPTLLSAE